MKISFIGAGNMCRAIVNGLLVKNVYDSDGIRVFDTDISKYRDFKKIGVYGASSLADAISFGDRILLAVKPQNYESLLAEIKGCGVSLDNKTFISIAAAISTSYIEKQLGRELPIIRVMPNTPMLIGLGAAAICRNPRVGDTEFNSVTEMFSVLGVVSVMDEEFLNNVISVNGSSPAYVYLFAKAMRDEAIRQGIGSDEAMKLICASIIGSATMLEQSGKTPDELIKAVASPGGTTLAALDSFADSGFEKSIADAMAACSKRAGELAR